MAVGRLCTRLPEPLQTCAGPAACEQRSSDERFVTSCQGPNQCAEQLLMSEQLPAASTTVTHGGGFMLRSFACSTNPNRVCHWLFSCCAEHTLQAQKVWRIRLQLLQQQLASIVPVKVLLRTVRVVPASITSEMLLIRANCAHPWLLLQGPRSCCTAQPRHTTHPEYLSARMLYVTMRMGCCRLLCATCRKRDIAPADMLHLCTQKIAVVFGLLLEPWFASMLQALPVGCLTRALTHRQLAAVVDRGNLVSRQEHCLT